LASNPKTHAAYANAASTLEELVAPLTEDEFLASQRQRKLVHLRSANNGCYSQLAGWAALRRLLAQGAYPSRREHIRVVRESEPAPTGRYLRNGKADIVRLEECLKDGFSIVLNHIEEHVPALDTLCQNLRARRQENTHVGAIVTTGAEGAFRVHYDPEDLIILQVEGRKRWHIFGPPVSDPLRGMVKPSPPPQDAPPDFDEVLEPGDFLFVPAGYWHHCQTLTGRSIHLGVFFIPPTSWNAVKTLTAELLDEPLFREPLTRVENAAQLAALEAEVKKRLIEKISAMSLRDFPAEWIRTITETKIREQQAREQKRCPPMRTSNIRVVVDENSAARPTPGSDSSGLPKRQPPSHRTGSFLDRLSLQTLIAPVPTEEFRAHHWEQTPLIVQRGNPEYYGDLFTLDDFDAAVTRSPSYVKLANAESKKNQSYKPVVQGLEAVLADMRAGGTLILDQMHKTDPKLSLLCRGLAPELGHRFQTNLYLTPPHGKGFTPHWDNHDVFILQVFGSKHWKIETTRRTLPAPSQSMSNDEGRELRGEVSAVNLQQGDLIYIPRGWVHAAECGEEPSLHITLGVTAFFFEDLFAALIKAARRRDESLNAALPLGFMRGSGDELVQRVKAALHDMSDDHFLTEVIDQYRDELVTSFDLDISGQVRDFFCPRPLTLDEIVGPRRGSVCRIHQEADSVRVNFGARSITFLGLFREALDFALNTPSYAVREVKGDLADEERLVFIERLLEEGLVMRQANGRA